MKEPNKKKELVNRTRFSNAIRNDLMVAFHELHKDTSIPMSKLLDDAIELLLEKHNRHIPK
jgi:hypothetical protein